MTGQRKYTLERVGPAQVVQLYADGFEKLTTKEKIFAYYIYLAGLAGRDIAIDQHHRFALEIRDLLEKIFIYHAGIEKDTLNELIKYLKLFWINNGFYDNLTSRKFIPEISFEEFRRACIIAQNNGAKISKSTEDLEEKIKLLKDVIFNPDYEPQMTNKTPGEDWIKGSAVNFYDRSISQIELDSWVKKGKEKNPLNSKVIKKDGELEERIWRAGDEKNTPGLYANYLNKVIFYLDKAIHYAANEHQAETISLLIKFLKSGDLEDFRKFNISWVKDSVNVDFILGFIEVYLDPRGQKAEWESSVYFINSEQTKLMENLATYAQYFEDKAPWNDSYKKKIEKSPIANVVNVISATGGCGPISPIGINLPNEQFIREKYGSKSILLHNVVDAIEKSTGLELVREFAADEQEITLHEKYGSIAGNLHTAMHEVIGHGSGKVSAKLEGKDPADFLPGYYNTLEETRADLVALWNAFDPKIIDIGYAKDENDVILIGKTMYQQAIRAGFTQLRRIGNSDQLEEDHMKNRQLIFNYLLENSNAIQIEKKNGKTYFKIVDYDLIKKHVGILLAEVMRIKAEGDLISAKKLIDKYALKVDIALRNEVQSRANKLNLPVYTGFVMPELEPIIDHQGNINDIKIEYPLDLATQMIRYSNFSKQT